MTKLTQLARAQYGSTRKMILAQGLKEGTVYPVLSGYRKAWPRLRQQLATALEVNEGDIFTPDGWPVAAEEPAKEAQ